MKNMLLIAIAAATVAIAPAFAQTMSASAYVKAAGAGDLYERTSSQIVLQSTQNPRIREFADMMIAHHTKSTADVKAAAKQAGIAVPTPKLTAAQSSQIAQLRAARGSKRDTAYVSQQKLAHDQALALHKGFASNGRSEPLRKTAAAIVPVIEQHIQALNAM